MTFLFARPSNGNYNPVLKSQKLWLWVIIVVGASLRLYGLDFQSLWVDEGLQFYVASNYGMSEIFYQTNSFHPPLSFIINRAFLQIGESEFFLRLPSALFGIASLPAFYVLAKKLTSPQVAVLGVFLLAISPFHVWYSQEGRGYSQLIFFSLLSSALLIQALERGKARWWVYYTIIGAAGMYTHVLMVLALIAQFLWVSLYHRRRLVAHTASGAMVFLSFLPWTLLLPWAYHFFERVSGPGTTMATPAGQRAGFRAGVSLVNVPYTLFAYSSGFSIGPSVAELHEDRSLGFILQFVPEILLVGVVSGTLLVVGIFALYKLFGARSTAFCLLGLCLPVLGALLYAAIPRTAYNVRYSIVAFPYFCILLATGLSAIRQKNGWAGVICLLAISAISLTSLANHYFNPRYAKEDVKSAVAFWRSVSKNEPLLSYKVDRAVSVYLRDSEEKRHSRIRGDIVSNIRLFLSETKTPHVYVLLARDWRQLKENEIRNAFSVDNKRSYPGVTIIKISRNGVRASPSPSGESRIIGQTLSLLSFGFANSSIFV